MADAPTPFAAMLQQYMWKRREPPITAAKLASEIGLNRQTVLNWLNGSRPSADLLPLVAEKIGVSLADVYRAAGYAVPAELQRREDIFDYLRERLEHDSTLSAENRRVILKHVRELQAGYASASDDEGNASDPKASRIALAR